MPQRLVWTNMAARGIAEGAERKKKVQYSQKGEEIARKQGTHNAPREACRPARGLYNKRREAAEARQENKMKEGTCGKEKFETRRQGSQIEGERIRGGRLSSFLRPTSPLPLWFFYLRTGLTGANEVSATDALRSEAQRRGRTSLKDRADSQPAGWPCERAIGRASATAGVAAATPTLLFEIASTSAALVAEPRCSVGTRGPREGGPALHHPL